MDEIELKFLNIDVEEIKKKLIDIGAVLKYDTNLQSCAFTKEGFDPFNSGKKLLRVRKINEDTFLTYKGPCVESNMTNREEIEIKVDNYNQTCELIKKLGFELKRQTSKTRIHYELGNIHFELDTLEDIPTYLEIETNTEKDMIDICKRLELGIFEGKSGTIVEILPELLK